MNVTGVNMTVTVIEQRKPQGILTISAGGTEQIPNGAYESYNQPVVSEATTVDVHYDNKGHDGVNAWIMVNASRFETLTFRRQRASTSSTHATQVAQEAATPTSSTAPGPTSDRREIQTFVEDNTTHMSAETSETHETQPTRPPPASGPTAEGKEKKTSAKDHTNPTAGSTHPSGTHGTKPTRPPQSSDGPLTTIAVAGSATCLVIVILVAVVWCRWRKTQGSSRNDNDDISYHNFHTGRTGVVEVNLDAFHFSSTSFNNQQARTDSNPSITPTHKTPTDRSTSTYVLAKAWPGSCTKGSGQDTDQGDGGDVELTGCITFHTTNPPAT
ncbi:uncharacterized protein LOC124112379 [Haliotis rufescens]|uniref:uncharacterized protein LOC124112379 n=1 Tax=Haliotis rufescens TaxID=6454 RepID=UPI00201EF214|nr:uncharacterized protein LOC124112379 [Haliotis rufescens]